MQAYEDRIICRRSSIVRAGGAPPRKPLTPQKSRRYCRRLARRHYENFTAVSWLAPRQLRQHLCNLYAYCRWADDLADEVGNPQQSLNLLRWWEQQLHECYAGRATHPVFIALGETVRQFGIPAEPLVDLLVAMRQDQRVTRYETLGQVLEYCRYSANPVGRLVLYVGECFNADRARLSDAICTGLQLANFCQDVARDWDRGRIYLPAADCRRFGYGEVMFARREHNVALRRLLEQVADEADGRLRHGFPLILAVPEDLQLAVALFVHGGLAILEAIRRQNYDVWTRRPTIGRWEKLRLTVSCWWKLLRGTLREPPRNEPDKVRG